MFNFLKKKEKKIKVRNRRKEFADKFCFVRFSNPHSIQYTLIELTKNSTYCLNMSEIKAHLDDKEWWEKFWYLAKYRKKGYRFYYS